MKLSNLTFIRFGVLALAILLFLIGAGVSSCSAQYAFNSPSKSSITGDFKEIKWPTSGVAQMLPEPESKYGKFQLTQAPHFMHILAILRQTNTTLMSRNVKKLDFLLITQKQKPIITLIMKKDMTSR